MPNLWRDGRVVECGGLENRFGVTPRRGFKSHSLRFNKLLAILESQQRLKIHIVKLVNFRKIGSDFGSIQ